jgi:hypothetical protein
MSATLERDDVTLLDVLDRVLDKGIVLTGNLTISVAGVDLIFVDLALVIGQCMRKLDRNGSPVKNLARLGSSPERLP